MHVDPEAARQYPEAAKELSAWYKVVTGVRWRNFLEVLEVFKDADAMDEYVAFTSARTGIG